MHSVTIGAAVIAVAASVYAWSTVGMYFVQLRAHDAHIAAIEDTYTRNTAALSNLQKTVDQAFAVNSPLYRPYKDSVALSEYLDQGPVAASSFVRLTQPARDRVCIGDVLPLSWKTSPDIVMVEITLNSKQFSEHIGVFPSSYEEDGSQNNTGTFMWTAGETVLIKRNLAPGTYTFHLGGVLPASHRKSAGTIMETDIHTVTVSDCSKK